MTDYCKHGVYVGGCGIDWMCHACEMGDVEPTPTEAADRMVELFGRYISRRTELLTLIWDAKDANTSGDTAHLDSLAGRILNGDQTLFGAHENLANFYGAVRNWQEACEWAEGPDDNDWLARRHRILTEQEEAARADWSTADHIAALPLHIQEGSY
jgi:hypothetical protein